MLELGEDLLYRIEVGAVGRQIEDRGTSIFNGSLDAGNFVAAEIIQDDEIPGLERRRESLLCPCSEAVAIDWTIEDPDRVEAAVR
jgi:hypothetical protein